MAIDGLLWPMVGVAKADTFDSQTATQVVTFCCLKMNTRKIMARFVDGLGLQILLLDVAG